MKKIFLIVIFIVSVFSIGLFSVSCSKSNSTGPDPVATPVRPYMAGGLFQVNGNALIAVNLKIGGATGSVLTGSTVTLNGAAVAESGAPGVYFAEIAGGYSTGTTLNIVAVTSLGTASATGIMQAGDTVTAPANGSTISHLNLFQVNWTGLTTGIYSHEVVIYLSTFLESTIDHGVLPSVLSYTVGAGDLPVGTYAISVLAEKLLSLTNATADSQFFAGNSANTFTVTIN